MCALLGALKSDGVLVIQEIGELREPEQMNVPWQIEDIIELFAVPGCTSNPRSTTSRRSRTPLTHMLVHRGDVPPDATAFAAKVSAIWTQMKERTLDDIRGLYASQNPDDQRRLQHLLITNANLDLNKLGS
jgi:hypothetical protein